jgi:hypothetical protein
LCHTFIPQQCTKNDLKVVIRLPISRSFPKLVKWTPSSILDINGHLGINIQVLQSIVETSLAHN